MYAFNQKYFATKKDRPSVLVRMLDLGQIKCQCTTFMLHKLNSVRLCACIRWNQTISIFLTV